MTGSKYEQMLFELYCQDIITKDELKERFIDRQKAERRKSIERYLDLFLEGHITKEALVDVLAE